MSIASKLRTSLFLVAVPALLASAACTGGPSDADSDGAVGPGDDASIVGDASPDGMTIPVDAAQPDATDGVPVFFNPRDDLNDNDLADQALALLSDSQAGNCSDCHGITKQRLYHWRALSDSSVSECLTDLSVPNQTVAREMINCLREDPNNSNSFFDASHAAIFSTGAHLAWFKYTFEIAYGASYLAPYNEFLNRIGMPKGGNTPYNQSQFDIIASWFTRGLPLIEAKLPGDPAPTECTPGVSSVVTNHVAETALSGWRAVNEQNGILMHGCNPMSNDVFDCLSTYPSYAETPAQSNWAANVPNQQIRVLRENGYRSSFWTRSSADGRYVGHGATSGGTNTSNANSMIVDLKRDYQIPGTAYYDPSFFPDNSGFMFQTGRAYMCNQSFLSDTKAVTYDAEPECTYTNNIGLYQHVGADVGSGDYWAVAAQFTSDNGGGRTFSDPNAGFSSNSTARLTPVVHDGSNYSAGERISKSIPYEGDTIISASSKMLLSRLRGPGGSQMGFVMRQLNATETQQGYDIEIPEVARYCFNGGKPAFSYDDRWLVLHHYLDVSGDTDAIDLGFSGSSDPGFSDYQNDGAANIYLIDTLTGDVTRITTMNSGEYALFPHFRSDGWIYFIVRSVNYSGEYIVASDAALRLEQ